MIALTRSGARLLDGREDWRLLDALVLAIAQAAGFPGTEAGAAQTYLLALDPPTADDDVVVWSWTEAPVRRMHVCLTPLTAVRPAARS